MFASPLQDDILAELKKQPATFRQLSNLLGTKPQAIGPAVWRLVRKGLVIQHGFSKPPHAALLFAAKEPSCQS